MVLIAKEKKKVFSLREISEKESIPFDYLEKIVSRLKKEGFLKSKKGAKGGYSLVSAPGKIKVGKIIKSLEGDISLVRCVSTKNKFICPEDKKCLTKNFWKKLQSALEKTLNSFSLADLIK